MIKQTLRFIASLFLKGYSFAIHYLIFRLLDITMLEKNGKPCNKKKKRFDAEFERCLALLFPPRPQRHYFSKYKKIFQQIAEYISSDYLCALLCTYICTLVSLRLIS